MKIGIMASQISGHLFSATGGTTYTSGGYKYHKFTGNGTFAVSGAGTVEVLLIAGGGGGAKLGAGGAGGVG